MTGLDLVQINRIDLRTAGRCLSHWHTTLARSTRIAYAADLQDFGAWLGADYLAGAQILLGCDPGRAHEIGAAYAGHLRASGLASRTIKRRLSALRSFVRAAAELGAVTWELRIRGPKLPKKRTIVGPDWPDIQRVLTHMLEILGEPAGARDGAILLLMIHSALRRAEIAGLLVSDLELAACHVWIVRKGETDRTRWPISRAAARALGAWLGHRGAHPGPVWSSIQGPGRPSSGISTDALRRIVARRAGELGLVGWRPHGLRHAALTQLVRLDPANLRDAQALAGHASVTTTEGYLTAIAGREARAVALIAGELDAGPSSAA